MMDEDEDKDELAGLKDRTGRVEILLGHEV